MKHMVQWNWLIRLSDIVSASVVRVMLVSVNLHEINKEKVPYEKLIESATSLCSKTLEAGSYPSLQASFITTCQGFLTCVCRRTTCNDLFGEAQLKRGVFFRHQVTHRDGGGSGTRFLGHTDGSLRSPPRVRNLVPELRPVPVCKEVCPPTTPKRVSSHIYFMLKNWSN